MTKSGFEPMQHGPLEGFLATTLYHLSGVHLNSIHLTEKADMNCDWTFNLLAATWAFYFLGHRRLTNTSPSSEIQALTSLAAPACCHSKGWVVPLVQKGSFLWSAVDASLGVSDGLGGGPKSSRFSDKNNFSLVSFRLLLMSHKACAVSYPPILKYLSEIVS